MSIKKILKLSTLLIILICVKPCSAYSQSLPSDTIICLNATEVRALLKLKAERDYLHSQLKVMVKADSLKTKVIIDNDKTINKLSLNLADAETKYNDQLNKKENWRNTSLIGIPVSILTGIILSIFL